MTEKKKNRIRSGKGSKKFCVCGHMKTHHKKKKLYCLKCDCQRFKKKDGE